MSDTFLDEMKVRAVIDRYFHCADAGDFAKMRTIFTDDADFEFSTSPTERKQLKGAQGIADYLQDRNKLFRTKTHFVAHAEIEINGNVAKKNASFYEIYGKATYTFNDQWAAGIQEWYSPSVASTGLGQALAIGQRAQQERVDPLAHLGAREQAHARGILPGHGSPPASASPWTASTTSSSS